MGFEGVAAVVCFVTIVVGLAITHPLELRRFRWLKIILSLPVVVLISSGFYELQAVQGQFAIWGIAVLAFMWKSELAHYLSLAFCRLLFGDQNLRTGVRADIAGARALYQNGDADDALRHLQLELVKEPNNYEGLLLLSELHLEINGLEAAIRPLDQLLRNGTLTREQRHLIQNRKEKLQERLLVEQINARQ